MPILYKLIIAHLLADFFLFTGKWIQERDRNRFRSWHLYVHGLIHFISLMLFVPHVDFLGYAAGITLSHIIIDGLKPDSDRASGKTWIFIGDQLLHLMVLMIAWGMYADIRLGNIIGQYPFVHWEILIGFVLLTNPVRFLIGSLMSNFSQSMETNPSSEMQSFKGMVNAGTWIGIIERVLILIFILADQWGAIGAMLGAKSIFRFGDLTRAKDLHLTEYVLIGTMLSYGIAIITGLVLKGFLFSF